MIIEVVNDVLRKRNQFLAKNGVSDKISLLTVVNGDGPPDYNKMKFEFGTYGQAFQSNNLTNTNTTRSVGAIALSMTSNKMIVRIKGAIMEKVILNKLQRPIKIK